MLDISLVGTGGMMPLPNRFLSSMIIRYKKQTILIDTGEGTQVSLKILGWGFKNIDIICLTHFHADHVAGLPGLLHTIANSGKTSPLTIIGPLHLKQVIDSLLIIARCLPFPIIYKEITVPTTLMFSSINISTLPVDHRTDCIAYCIQTLRLGKFNIQKATNIGLPKNYFSLLQNGVSVTHEGKLIHSRDIMGLPRKGFKIAYCTDTRPVSDLPMFVKEADIFICEGIYGEDTKLNKAKEYKHMLFSEAATIAKKANVKELWLTHYSPSLTDPSQFLHVAQNIFSNSHIGYDHKTTTLKYIN